MDKETCSQKPQNEVFIHGVFLEGAMWKKKALCDLSTGQMNQAMQVIHFQQTDKYIKKEENYLCPVYKTSDRAGVLSTTD